MVKKRSLTFGSLSNRSMGPRPTTSSETWFTSSVSAEDERIAFTHRPAGLSPPPTVREFVDERVVRGDGRLVPLQLAHEHGHRNNAPRPGLGPEQPEQLLAVTGRRIRCRGAFLHFNGEIHPARGWGPGAPR